MNFRNKYLVITVRIVLGLSFIFSGVTGWMMGLSGMAGVPAEMLVNTQALWDTGIFQLVKTAEIVAGLLLVIGVAPAVAVVVLTPVAIGAAVVTALTSPHYIYTALVCTVLLAYLAYVYWDKYKPLFRK
jgi:uncharacterized membrane protein YphA (DoxX/SURF4 family)